VANWTDQNITSANWTKQSVVSSTTSSTPIGLTLLFTRTTTEVGGNDWSIVGVQSGNYTDSSVNSNDYAGVHVFILANDSVVQANSSEYDARGVKVGTNLTNSADWS